jgi:hydrogenase maturation protease
MIFKERPFLPTKPDEEHNYPVTILGLGNVLLSDEGVGVHTLNALRNRYSFSPLVELVDGGTMGLDLLPFFQDRNRILIIDAVDFKSSPGHIGAIEGQDIPAILNPKFSAHHIGLADLLFTAKLTRTTLPEICLVGIQPETFDVGLEMSDRIRGQMHQLIIMALRKLHNWGINSLELTDSA